MQTRTRLELMVAKLKLREMEVLDKLSESHNDYIIRCITDPNTFEFLAVNGDWTKVTGFTEEACKGKSWLDFLPEKEKEEILLNFQQSNKDNEGFTNFSCNLLKKNGTKVNVDWKTKFYPSIGATVSIGRVKK